MRLVRVVTVTHQVLLPGPALWRIPQQVHRLCGPTVLTPPFIGRVRDRSYLRLTAARRSTYGLYPVVLVVVVAIPPPPAPPTVAVVVEVVRVAQRLSHLKLLGMFQRMRSRSAVGVLVVVVGRLRERMGVSRLLLLAVGPRFLVSVVAVVLARCQPVLRAGPVVVSVDITVVGLLHMAAREPAGRATPEGTTPLATPALWMVLAVVARVVLVATVRPATAAQVAVTELITTPMAQPAATGLVHGLAVVVAQPTAAKVLAVEQALVPVVRTTVVRTTLRPTLVLVAVVPTPVPTMMTVAQVAAVQ